MLKNAVQKMISTVAPDVTVDPDFAEAVWELRAGHGKDSAVDCIVFNCESFVATMAAFNAIDHPLNSKGILTVGAKPNSTLTTTTRFSVMNRRTVFYGLIPQARLMRAAEVVRGGVSIQTREINLRAAFNTFITHLPAEWKMVFTRDVELMIEYIIGGTGDAGIRARVGAIKWLTTAMYSDMVRIVYGEPDRPEAKPLLKSMLIHVVLLTFSTFDAMRNNASETPSLKLATPQQLTDLFSAASDSAADSRSINGFFA